MTTRLPFTLGKVCDEKVRWRRNNFLNDLDDFRVKDNNVWEFPSSEFQRLKFQIKYKTYTEKKSMYHLFQFPIY